MDLDITSKVTEVVSKLQGSAYLLEKFKKKPLEVVKSIIGKGFSKDILQKIVDAVKAKLNLTDVAETTGGLLASLKGLFGQK